MINKPSFLGGHVSGGIEPCIKLRTLMPGRNCLEIALLQMVLPSPQVRRYVGEGTVGVGVCFLLVARFTSYKGRFNSTEIGGENTSVTQLYGPHDPIYNNWLQGHSKDPHVCCASQGQSCKHLRVNPLYMELHGVIWGAYFSIATYIWITQFF